MKRLAAGIAPRSPVATAVASRVKIAPTTAALSSLPPPAHLILPQVAAALDACSAWLLEHALNPHPGLTLRVALDLGLSSLAAQIEREFLRVGHRNTAGVPVPPVNLIGRPA